MEEYVRYTEGREDVSVKRVADLVEELRRHDQELPVFVRMWNDRGPGDDYLKIEPLWDGHVAVESVAYDMPHIGGYYGSALVLGDSGDE